MHSTDSSFTLSVESPIDRVKAAAEQMQSKSSSMRGGSEKQPDLCVVQKKALKFVHNQYKDDSRYAVDPGEERRVRFLDRPELERAHKDYTEAQRKELMAGHAQIECSDHNEHGDAEAGFVQALYDRFAAFYGDLLDERHNKVALEKLCRCFVEQIKAQNDYNFRDLRRRILSLGDFDYESFYLKLRETNPEMFLKADKLPDEPRAKFMQFNHKDQVEAMDAREHHQSNFNPNRQIYVNKLIFETLIKGMVDAESGKANPGSPRPEQKTATNRKINKLLDINLSCRELERRRTKLLKKMS